ncbi:MAG: GMC family oxidoreductase [Marinovum sp.]|nr:GMC family oxidoreductase [Marinovum sp.]
MSEIDVIVIGTGMGGGTIGRHLAEAGARVLFLEKGKTQHPNEERQLHAEMFEPTGRLVRGLWPAPLDATVDGHTSRSYAPIGSGVGGSSSFYAATLERPERHDIDHSSARAHPTGGWPIDYDTLAPRYDRAEELYEICGAPDPLSPEPQAALIAPPPLTRADESLKASFEANGLHPYRLHAAIRYEADGTPQQTLDGRTAGVLPALASGKAGLRDRCDVQRILPGPDGIAVEAICQGRAETFNARQVVLAAGAFGTPRLAMRSELPDPSGLIGRNLMFHLNEMIALWPKDKAASGPSKALSLRDLYHLEGQRFGTVQAMGIDVTYGEIVYFLDQTLARSKMPKLPGQWLALRAAAGIAARIFGQAKIFVGLLEDLPYAENRVKLTDDDTLACDYTIHPELRARRKAFRKAMAQAFRGHLKWFLSMQPELNFGHGCGTMKMGHDPATSVTDPQGRLRECPGLWVADASLFPTSMGVNPSLTIAALALHVGDAILETLKKGPTP